MAGTSFRRSLAFVVMPLVVILWVLIFVSGRGLWDKIAALEAGVFAITALTYFVFRFETRPEEEKQVPIKSRAGCVGMRSLLCTLVGMVLYYSQTYAGLRLVDMTIAFPILFFVPTVTFLIYVIALVVARFHPSAGTRSHS